jgi:hypothetical protein
LELPTVVLPVVLRPCADGGRSCVDGGDWGVVRWHPHPTHVAMRPRHEWGTRRE